jgi:hypothetical protein
LILTSKLPLSLFPLPLPLPLLPWPLPFPNNPRHFWAWQSIKDNVRNTTGRANETFITNGISISWGTIISVEVQWARAMQATRSKHKVGGRITYQSCLSISLALFKWINGCNWEEIFRIGELWGKWSFLSSCLLGGVAKIQTDFVNILEESLVFHCVFEGTFLHQ